MTSKALRVFITKYGFQPLVYFKYFTFKFSEQACLLQLIKYKNLMNNRNMADSWLSSLAHEISFKQLTSSGNIAVIDIKLHLVHMYHVCTAN